MKESDQRTVIDSRGSFCPGPLTDLYKAYRAAKIGDILELLATDPAAKSDIQAWCRKSGNEVIEIKDEKDYFRIAVKIVRKAG